MRLLRAITRVSERAKQYFIDTNIFLRALINDDERKYNDVITFFEGVKNNKFKVYTSGLVLAEIVWTLLSFYKLQKKEVVKSLESIINLNGLLFIENQNSARALDLFKDYNVKYIDCLICSGLQDNKKSWTVVSYDADFDKLGFRRIEPRGLI